MTALVDQLQIANSLALSILIKVDQRAREDHQPEAVRTRSRGNASQAI